MACSKQPGFSLPELLVSIAIVTLISTIAVVNLYSSQRKEELVTAQRVLAADIRAIQSRALSAQNVKTCVSAGKNITCETSTALCDIPANCQPAPPYANGMFFHAGSAAYPFFADVDVTGKDGMDTSGANEEYFTRSFSAVNAPNVQITSLVAAGLSVPDVNVSFDRQNGKMSIFPCTLVCAPVTTLTITMTQTQSGDTKTISLNAITGRVSLD